MVNQDGFLPGEVVTDTYLPKVSNILALAWTNHTVTDQLTVQR